MAEEDDLSGRKALITFEISKYYNSHNFVVSYSTPSERDKIRKIQDYRQLALLPDRLKKISLMMYSLDETIQGAKYRTCEEKTNIHKSTLLPELNEITGMREIGARQIRVDVFVRPLSPYENALLIAEYEDLDINDSTLPHKNIKLRLKQIPRKEMHYWFKEGDNWVISPFNLVFIDN